MTADESTLTRPPSFDPEHRPPRPGDLLAGRFEVEEVLGKGGSGVVFAATDRVLMALFTAPAGDSFESPDLWDELPAIALHARAGVYPQPTRT